MRAVSDIDRSEGVRLKREVGLAGLVPDLIERVICSSFGSAAFEESAVFVPVPFLGGPRNLSVLITTSVAWRFSPFRSSWLLVLTRDHLVREAIENVLDCKRKWEHREAHIVRGERQCLRGRVH